MLRDYQNGIDRFYGNYIESEVYERGLLQFTAGYSARLAALAKFALMYSSGKRDMQRKIKLY